MSQTTKLRTNVSVDAELLQEARARNINVSGTLEEALRAKLKRVREEAWLAENRQAFEDANKFIETHGLWSDGLRLF